MLSGSDDWLASSVTFSGTEPLAGLTLTCAIGAASGRHRLSERNAYAAAPVVSGIVSFVPPVPGMAAGAAARTLARGMLVAGAGASGAQLPLEQAALAACRTAS